MSSVVAAAFFGESEFCDDIAASVILAANAASIPASVQRSRNDTLLKVAEHQCDTPALAIPVPRKIRPFVLLLQNTMTVAH